MKRSEISSMPKFFDRYIIQVEDIDIVQALEKFSSMENLVDVTDLKRLGDKVYAPGKWTVKEVIQHITDNERVQAYRAMRISRNDKTPLPGYDENLFADNVNVSTRSLDDLLEEFTLVRKANMIMFKNMNDEQQKIVGLCNNVEISVLALGFVLVGHQLHHAKIINERYLPLLKD